MRILRLEKGMLRADPNWYRFWRKTYVQLSSWSLFQAWFCKVLQTATQVRFVSFGYLNSLEQSQIKVKFQPSEIEDTPPKLLLWWFRRPTKVITRVDLRGQVIVRLKGGGAPRPKLLEKSLLQIPEQGRSTLGKEVGRVWSFKFNFRSRSQHAFRDSHRVDLFDLRSGPIRSRSGLILGRKCSGGPVSKSVSDFDCDFDLEFSSLGFYLLVMLSKFG